jgi:hypothetical protein
MPSGLISMAAVNMEKVNGAILEVLRGLVKSGSNQAGEPGVEFLVVGHKLMKHLLPVEAGLYIPFPGIDCIAPGRQSECLDSLAKRGVGGPVLGPQFHQVLRL